MSLMYGVTPDDDGLHKNQFICSESHVYGVTPDDDGLHKNHAKLH